MSDTTGLLDADKMDLMLLLRDQRNALCRIAQAFGWNREDWTIERLVAEAARLGASVTPAPPVGSFAAWYGGEVVQVLGQPEVTVAVLLPGAERPPVVMSAPPGELTPVPDPDLGEWVAGKVRGPNRWADPSPAPAAEGGGE